MKYSPTLLAFAALLAIVYGVLFSVFYPLIEISGGIVALCVLFGIVTCLVAAAIWDLIARPKMAAAEPAKTTPADTAAPVLPFVKPAARASRRRKR